MKAVLDALRNIGGVRMAALVMKDGVPVVCSGADPALEADALGALAAGYLRELEQAATALSLPTPRRALVRATRGSVYVHNLEAGLLVVLVDSGAPLEQVGPALDAAVTRLTRRTERTTAPLIHIDQSRGAA